MVDRAINKVFRGYLSSKSSFGQVNRRFYCRKFRFTVTRQRNRKNAICDHKTDDLPHKMTFFASYITILMLFFSFFL